MAAKEPGKPRGAQGYPMNMTCLCHELGFNVPEISHTWAQVCLWPRSLEWPQPFRWTERAQQSSATCPTTLSQEVGAWPVTDRRACWTSLHTLAVQPNPSCAFKKVTHHASDSIRKLCIHLPIARSENGWAQWKSILLLSAVCQTREMGLNFKATGKLAAIRGYTVDAVGCFFFFPFLFFIYNSFDKPSASYIGCSRCTSSDWIRILDDSLDKFEADGSWHSSWHQLQTMQGTLSSFVYPPLWKPL